MTPESPSDSLTTWLPSLRCPLTAEGLLQVDSATLATFNTALVRGQVRNELGDLSDRQLDAALINQGGTFLYPIRCGIPILLHGEAIALEQIRAGTPKQAERSDDRVNRQSPK